MNLSAILAPECLGVVELRAIRDSRFPLRQVMARASVARERVEAARPRNQQIMAMYLAGKPLREIAARFGISIPRVYEIAMHCGAPRRRLRKEVAQ